MNNKRKEMAMSLAKECIEKNKTPNNIMLSEGVNFYRDLDMKVYAMKPEEIRPGMRVFVSGVAVDEYMKETGQKEHCIDLGNITSFRRNGNFFVAENEREMFSNLNLKAAVILLQREREQAMIMGEQVLERC